ncbi:hypothetical protein JCM10449v2_002409 [Rhodotorula kratochvilovae]
MEQLGDEWTAFVEAAAAGAHATAFRPPRPAVLSAVAPLNPPTALAFDDEDLSACPLPARVGTADQALETYKETGWLPAVRGPHEEERLKVLRRFGLQDVGQVAAVDRIAETAKAIFKTNTVTVSCMLEDKGMFIATRGWRPEETDPQQPRLHAGLEASICTHAMQKSQDQGCFILPSAKEDWRFANSPYVRPEGAPINFFASANVDLPTLVVERGKTVPSRLPIGSLCIVDPEPRGEDAVSESDQLILRNLADLIAREFELGFERKRNEAAKRQTDYLGNLFRSLAVAPDTPGSSDSLRTDSDMFVNVSSHLQQLTSASFCAVIDLRAFNAPPPPAPAARTTEGTASPSSTARPDSPLAFSPTDLPRPPFARTASNSSNLTRSSASGETRSSTPPSATSTFGNSGSCDGVELASHFGRDGMDPSSRRRRAAGRLEVLDSADASSSSPWDWRSALGHAEVALVGEGDEASLAQDERNTRARRDSEVLAETAKSAVAAALHQFYDTRQMHFDASSKQRGPLAPILPADTTAYLSVPCFFDDEPTLLLVVGSRTRHFQFELADQQFVENAGAVLVGSLLRRALVQADLAKLAFVSQISHELRTPLFGIGSQLELIKNAADPAALASISPFLAMADVCVSSLREILDSVLEFSKQSHATTNEPKARSAASPRTLVDLETLVIDVVKSCWSRVQQVRRALLSSHSDTDSPVVQGEADDKVDIVLEYDLPPGTQVSVDVGGLKRALINLVGNGLKYTQRGSVVIAVSSPALPDKERGVASIQLDVADTGRGIDPEFLRDHLFTPFRQANSFNEGNGLGVSISDNIIRRMGGTLRYTSEVGVGTTASIAVPLEVHLPPAAPRSTHGAPQRRVLSAELEALLNPVSPISSPPITPEEVVPVKSTAIAAGGTALKLSTSIALDHARFTAPQLAPLALNLPTTALPPSDAPIMSSPVHVAVPAAAARVLVADDNPIARRVLTMYLRSRKPAIEFTEAANGAEAVERFTSFRPTLVWCDVQMPVLDGLGATREMRRLEAEGGWARARIVAISGLSSSLGKHERTLDSGQIDLWVTKSAHSLRELAADLEEHRVALAAPVLEGCSLSDPSAAAARLVASHSPPQPASVVPPLSA